MAIKFLSQPTHHASITLIGQMSDQYAGGSARLPAVLRVNEDMEPDPSGDLVADVVTADLIITEAVRAHANGDTQALADAVAAAGEWLTSPHQPLTELADTVSELVSATGGPDLDAPDQTLRLRGTDTEDWLARASRMVATAADCLSLDPQMATLTGDASSRYLAHVDRAIAGCAHGTVAPVRCQAVIASTAAQLMSATGPYQALTPTARVVLILALGPAVDAVFDLVRADG